MSNLLEGFVLGDFFFLLVRICERVVSVVVFCDDWFVNFGFCGGEFDDGEELNADDNVVNVLVFCFGLF